jgi:hypothetical protein
MSRFDRLALLLSLLAVVITYLVTMNIFEGVPHIEDEIALVWEARVIDQGTLTIATPPHPTSYLVPFVVDYNGQRFSKYPPGWPVLLAIAIRFGLRAWINPLLGGLAVWLTYRIGKRLFSELVGILAAGLTLTSPFFLMNSGSLLSHPFGLVLTAAVALGWLEAFTPPVAKRPWIPTLAAALCMGALVITRPYTAVGVALPFALHGIYLLVKSDMRTRTRLVVFGIIVLACSFLYLCWQAAVTGDAFLNPYTLWWSYDKIGFGPGHGHSETGHTLRKAFINTRFSLFAGIFDLFGWAAFSWIMLPFGIIAARRTKTAWLVGSVFPSLVLVYAAYWVGSWLFGPRYYYEGLFSLTIFSAAGIAWLAGWPLKTGEMPSVRSGWRKARPLATTAFLSALVLFGMLVYTPMRLGSMKDLFGISLQDQKPFLSPSAQAFTPALVIVHAARWMPYGAMIDLESPTLDSPFIFAWSITPQIDQSLAQDFPDRKLFHYYPDRPSTLYTNPLPDEP